MLCEFIEGNRSEIIKRCRATEATRSMPPPIDAPIDHGVPLFLEQFAGALRLGRSSSPEVGASAMLHGHDLLLQGLTVSQVVHDYGDICQAITALAIETNAPISTEDFRTLNRCLDDAIAGAVTEYGRGRSQLVVEGEVARGAERLAFLTHELRNLAGTALIAFEVLKTGNVGVAGSTGGVLYRSLAGLVALINRSIEEIRVTQGVLKRQRFPVSELIDEVAPAAQLMAAAHGVTLAVMPTDGGVVIEADREILTAVTTNLLQNAFKFTKPCTTVTLRMGGSAERALIEVHDACGGLPGGDLDGMFRPFEQRGADRTGLGLGLAFGRKAVEANRGRLYARNCPDVGCVFTIDLPRIGSPATAAGHL